MLSQANVMLEDAHGEGHTYHVKLDVFEGPLDLLLHLIEKQELDITKVSLAAVTDQYLDYISRLEHLSAEILAGFLVVAAKLLLIKSRALLPVSTVPEEEEEESLGDELARQLREYKRFRQIAQQLREREKQGLRAYLRLVPPPQLERKLDLTGVSLDDLVTAVREALSLQPPSAPVDEIVTPVVISIGDQIKYLESLLAQRGSFSFNQVLRGAASRAEIIVTFLALLELIKADRVRVRQERLFGEIFVSPAENAESAVVA